MGTPVLPVLSDASVVAPVVIDLGKAKAKKVKALKRGSGDLVNEVASATNQVVASLGEAAKGKIIVPIVLVYRKKSRRRRNPFAL